MATSAVKKMRPKKLIAMFWASLHLSSIQAVPPSKSKGTRPQIRAMMPASLMKITIFLPGTNGKDAVSWPQLLPGTAQSSTAYSQCALTLQMPATLTYSTPARNPPTLLAPFFNIMSVCYKPVKPASSLLKALHSYNLKYSFLLLLPAFSKGESCFVPFFFKPVTCHTATISSKSTRSSCQQPRTEVHLLNHGKPQHSQFDGFHSLQQCLKMVLSNST